MAKLITMYAGPGSWGPKIQIQSVFGDRVWCAFSVFEQVPPGPLLFKYWSSDTKKWNGALEEQKLIGQSIYLSVKSTGTGGNVVVSVTGVGIKTLPGLVLLTLPVSEKELPLLSGLKISDKLGMNYSISIEQEAISSANISEDLKPSFNITHPIENSNDFIEKTQDNEEISNFYKVDKVGDYFLRKILNGTEKSLPDWIIDPPSHGKERLLLLYHPVTGSIIKRCYRITPYTATFEPVDDEGNAVGETIEVPDDPIEKDVEKEDHSRDAPEGGPENDGRDDPGPQDDMRD